MIMVRRDIYVDGFESSDYFSAYMPLSLPSTEFGFFMTDLLMPLKKKFYTTFVGDPYFMWVLESFEVVYEDGTKQDRPYAHMTRNSQVDPENCHWTIENIPNEYRPQNRQKEEEVLLKLINELEAKGYHTNKENISQFFNRRLDKLLLELNENSKSHKFVKPIV
jgi:hypothetical protein